MNHIILNLLEPAINWLNAYQSTLFSVSTALSISALMSLYDEQPLLKTTTGSLVCGIVTLTIVSNIEYLGISSDIVVFIGAAVGFMGADKVRKKVLEIIEKRLRKNKE